MYTILLEIWSILAQSTEENVRHLDYPKKKPKKYDFFPTKYKAPPKYKAPSEVFENSTQHKAGGGGGALY